MDTKKLEALAAAVEHGSFTRAAEALGYTQSGMTHMMNSLERDIGFPVLLRGRAGVRLTPAGERIYPLVRQVLSASQALDREIALINSHKEDTIRVAAYSSIAMHWLPEVIQQFRRIHPELTVDIQMGSVEEVYRWVREDKADMGFASLQDGMTMDWLPLAEDPLLAILPPEYDLGGRERFDVRDFSSHEFLMPSMGFHLDILRALNRSGVTPVAPPRCPTASSSPWWSTAWGSASCRSWCSRAAGTPCRRCPWTRRPSGSWASLPGTAGSCGPPPGASSPRPGTSFARSNRRSLC